MRRAWASRSTRASAAFAPLRPATTRRKASRRNTWQLQWPGCPFQAARDFEHRRGAFATEQHQASGPLRVEPEAFPLRAAVRLDRRIEARVQDHARRPKDEAIRMSQFPRLRHRAIRAADQILLLALN